MAIVCIEHDSPALKNNPLKDPSRRKLHLIVPDDLEAGEEVPCLWYLAGYAGVSRAMLSHDPWQEGLEERLQRLRAEGKLGKMIVALPDAFTKLGGCQYLSSPAVGDYENYLLKELRDLVEAKYSIKSHGIAGKSSGGYGAIVHGMKHPELFQAVACHSGDMGFEMSLIPDLPRLMNAVRDYGSVTELVDKFDAAVKKKDGRWFGPLSMLALCSVYSPDESQELGIGLPFDIESGCLRPAVLERWKDFDPVHMIDRAEYQQGISKHSLVFIDCGKRDEHFLHWGAVQLHHKLKGLGIEHEFELFDGGHRGTSHRLDVSLPRLYAALS